MDAIEKLLSAMTEDLTNAGAREGSTEERHAVEQRVIFGNLLDDPGFQETIDDVYLITLSALEAGVVTPRTAFNQFIMLGRKIEQELAKEITV